MTTLRTARYFPASNLRYTIVLKNACSTIQATLLEAEGISTSLFGVSQTHDATRNFRDADVSSARTLVVVRDPFKRFVSAFLDRVVVADFPLTGRTIVSAPILPLVRPDLQAAVTAYADSPGYGAGQQRILASLTFNDVVRIVALTPDDAIENHFKAQQWFMGGRHHDIVISMEAPGWQDTLAAVLGRPLVDMRPHETKSLVLAPGEVPDAGLLAVSEIRKRFADTGGLPSPSDFLTEDVTKLLERRYQKDFQFLAAL